MNEYNAQLDDEKVPDDEDIFCGAVVTVAPSVFERYDGKKVSGSADNNTGKWSAN